MSIKIETYPAEQVLFTVEDVDGKVAAKTTVLFGYDTVYNERFCFISNTFVDVEHRRQGLGEQILHAVLTEAMRRKVFRVITNAHFRLKGKQNWYGRSGFQKQGFYFCLTLPQTNTKRRPEGDGDESSIAKQEIEKMRGITGKRKRGGDHD